MFNKFFSVISNIFLKLVSLIFGKISWTPPFWLKILFSPLTKLISLNKNLYRKSKINFYVINLIIIVLALAGFQTYSWYKNLPKPNYVKYQISEILPTELKPESKPKPLTITFDSSSAKIELIGKAVQNGIIVSPELKGKWIWTTDKNLSFEPETDWTVGQKYNVTFSPEILAKHILLEKKSFEFITPKIIGQLLESKFYEDPIDPKLKQAVVSFKFTHPVNKTDFESKIEVGMKKVNEEQFSNKLNFKVLYNDIANEAYVRSDSIKIPDRDSIVKIKLNKNLHAALGGTGTDVEYDGTVNVPGVDNYFKIESASENILTNPKTHIAERFVLLSSTAAVKSEDIAKGTEILLLPVKPNDEESYDEYEGNYGASSCWNSPAEVPEELIAKAEKIKISPQENEEDLTTHLFKYTADEDRCLLVKVKAGTRSFSGYALSEDRNFLVSTGQFTKEVKILHDGALLAASGSKKLSIMGRNQGNLRFTIYRIFPEAVNHLITQTYPYNTFQNPGFNYNFGPENISEVFNQDIQLTPAASGLPQYTSFDFSNFLTDPTKFQGLFMLTVQGYDTVTKSYIGNPDSRLVLISDFGLLVKTNRENIKNVFVMSFANKDGVTDAAVEVIGKNGLKVFETKTDALGMAEIPDLKDLKLDKEPTAIIAKKGQDFSFIPWYKADRQLSYGQFDVGGIYPQAYAKSLVAYLFSDRGIYRPGEEARFGIVLKNKDWNSLESVPLELNIINPRGTYIRTEKISIKDPGFTEFKFKIPEEATLGGYSLELNLINDNKSVVTLGSTPFKVEEFMPDRLKISSEFTQTKKKGWLKPKDLAAKINLNNLFGTPAVGNKIKSTIKLYPSLPEFDEYEGFTFFDPLNTKNSFDEDLGENYTDEAGVFNLPINLSKYEEGIFFLRLLSEGFEKDGGRSVLTNLSTIVSPLDYLVGWKTNSDLNYLKLNTNHEVEILAVDQDLKLHAAKKLKIERIKKEHVSILSKLSNGDLAYKSVVKEISKEKIDLNLEAKITKFKLSTNEPGEFKYIITDEKGLVLNTIYYFVSGEGNVSRELERNAELKIKTDKNDYANGAEIEINIQAPYTGVGLITIEKDKVYQSKWFKTDSTNSIQKITVPEGLEGNAYINVSFVRALDSEEIYMSPLSYGVVPFSVSRNKRTEDLKIVAPAKVIPGNKLDLELISAEPTKVVVFAVDEGIHQVARYKQPDPLSHFFRKQALEVDTAQIVDLLIPEFEIAAKLAAVGGDEDGLLGKFRNPFKRKTQPPIAFWSSILDVSGSVKVSFNIPDYFNGNLKIYAVSVNAIKVGIASANTLVQNDLVLQPTAPLVVTPDDKFSVSTTVANTTNVVKDIKVSLVLDEKLKNISEKEQALKLEPGKEQLVSFELQAQEQLGSAQMKFSATADKLQSNYTLDLSVRPAASKITIIDTGVSQTNEPERLINLKDDFYPQYHEREITLANSPIGWISGLSRFLENYPYGCTEQITSQAFARLALDSNLELSYDKQETIKFIDKLFLILSSRQNSDGSISLWTNQEFTPDAAFPSIHAARFALEAKEAGFNIPEFFQTQLRGYLKQVAAGNNIDDSGFINRAYATYILARSGIVTSNYLASMKEDLVNAKLTKTSLALVNLFMAGTYKLLKLDDEANKLIKSAPVEVNEASLPASLYYMSKLGYFSFYLDIISRHFPEKAKELDSKVIPSYLNQINSLEYNTLSSSMFITSIIEYSELLADSINLEQTILFSKDGKEFIPQTVDNKKTLSKIKIAPEYNFMKIKSASKFPLYYQISDVGFQKIQALKQLRSGYEIQREYLDEKGTPITNFKQGDDVFVHLSFRATPGTPGQQSAIVDLLPAGLEVSGGTADLNGSSVSNITTDFYPVFKEAREDRVILIGAISENIQHFVYKVKASSAGIFTVPLASVESMYDLKSVSTTQPSKIEIKK